MWGVDVPLHESTGLNLADSGPIAASEMVRDWKGCKQCHNPSPVCMQTYKPAACR